MGQSLGKLPLSKNQADVTQDIRTLSRNVAVRSTRITHALATAVSRNTADTADWRWSAYKYWHHSHTRNRTNTKRASRGLHRVIIWGKCIPRFWVAWLGDFLPTKGRNVPATEGKTRRYGPSKCWEAIAQPFGAIRQKTRFFNAKTLS